MDKCCAAVDPDVNDFSALTPENEATGGVSPKTTSATEILPVHPARFQDKTSTLRKELLPTEQIALIPRYCGSVTAQLVEGEAEIFGCMVNAKERYKVSYPQRIVLASFSGCILEISATDYDEEVKRIVDDPFPKLVGAMHSILEEERRISRESKGHTPGPRLMVVGPMDSGKSSCCRTLLNYAVDGGWNPTFVDVDAGQQGLALPGSIAAAILRANIASDGRVEFFQRYDLPFGRLRLDEDTKLYKSQAENLAAAVLRNVGKSTHLDASGVIINTAGWIDEQGFGALVHIASEFKVNKILVLESESLGHRFQVWASEAEVALEVFYAKKPTCLMERTIETRRDYRDFVVLGAFSVNGQVLPPYMIPLNRLVFYQLASFHTVYLRSGKKIAVCNQVEFPAHCRDRVLAVSSAPHLEVDVKKYPVRGYAVLVSFDSYRNEAMIVSTLDLHQLPGTIVLLRGEVNASVLREHIPCADLGR